MSGQYTDTYPELEDLDGMCHPPKVCDYVSNAISSDIDEQGFEAHNASLLASTASHVPDADAPSGVTPDSSTPLRKSPSISSKLSKRSRDDFDSDGEDDLDNFISPESPGKSSIL